MAGVASGILDLFSRALPFPTPVPTLPLPDHQYFTPKYIP
ncbi:hypothetical protein CGLO_02801 [Colletotrichum gloeosporioides Cg-14]|uniref:Uncharacterized protein n=1 Tax=Colletotrichum gloeosporioides (strain Cg-14) TaxID=1237896 RepID=T0KN11_COLGC|nr:hypothetical protein CGLO_02801 [Colletotrichum gloeosporioides Cg-14]